MRRAAAPRACRGCGVPERQWKDDRGREQVNLEPTTQLCVTCLPKWRRGELEPQQPEQLAFDARAAAARNDE